LPDDSAPQASLEFGACLLSPGTGIEAAGAFRRLDSPGQPAPDEQPR
jgi:hypothetical protein